MENRNLPNLWMYYDDKTRSQCAAQIIYYSMQSLRKARLITHIDVLRAIIKGEYKTSDLIEFTMDYTIDCIRFIFFFESFMKAELVLRQLCVYKINSKLCKELSSIQSSQPISFKQIAEYQSFTINEKDQSINHPFIMETTIGIKELLEDDYKNYYDLDNEMYLILKYFRKERNNVHFKKSMGINVDTELVSMVEKTIAFLDKLQTRFVSL